MVLLLHTRKGTLHSQLIKSFSTSLHSKWQSKTQQLLETQEWNSSIVHQFQETLKYWTHQGDIQQCWELLDTLANAQDAKRKILPSSILQPIVHLWQRRYKENSAAVPVESPRQVAQRLKHYQQRHVIPSVIGQYVAAMILDAAKDDLEFSKKYLQEWIDDTNRDPPDVVAVGTVLQAHIWNPKEAEIFWEQILQQLPRLQPNEFWYNSMISAWAKQGNTEKVMEWLEQMRTNFEPDLATWNSVLSAWAKSTAEPAQAESILQQMHRLHKQGKLNQPPDVVSYSIVLDAWAQHSENNPTAAKKAQQLLEQMKSPNRISYNTVIQAHVRAGSPQQAEELLTAMLEQGIQPDDVTITVILSGWSQVGTWEAAERAERILQQVLPQLGLEPSVITYSACLACWAKVKQPAAMERAQALFDQLQHQHKKQPNLRPDVIAYTNLMHVYGTHGNAERVESILQDLLHSYEQSKDPQLKPNVHTFSVVVSAWSRRSTIRAQEWLLRMREYGVEPNVVSYTSVLYALSRQAKTDRTAPERARELLDQMQSQPNARSYTAVIRAYAEQGRAKEAQTLLESMLEHGPTPDVYTFSAVLYGWSKANPPLEAAQNAERLLMRMSDFQKPNVVCFGSVLLCWSRVPKGADRAAAILRTMKQYGVQPNLFCINIVMNAWAKQADIDETAVNRARTLLDESNHLKPDEYTYRAMFKAICASSLQNRKVLGYQLIDEMRQRGIQPNSYFSARLQSMNGNQDDIRRIS